MSGNIECTEGFTWDPVEIKAFNLQAKDDSTETGTEHHLYGPP